MSVHGDNRNCQLLHSRLPPHLVQSGPGTLLYTTYTYSKLYFVLGYRNPFIARWESFQDFSCFQGMASYVCIRTFTVGTLDS